MIEMRRLRGGGEGTTNRTKRSNILIRPRLLIRKVVGRETEHLEPPIPIRLV